MGNNKTVSAEPESTRARERGESHSESRSESEAALREFGHLACRVTLDLPVEGFTVEQLFGLREGSVVDSGCPAGSDLPLSVNGVRVGWGRAEARKNRVAVRVTDFD